MHQLCKGKSARGALRTAITAACLMVSTTATTGFATQPSQGGQSQGTAKSQSGGLALEASIEPLLEYTPLGPTSPERTPYWKKHIPDDAPDQEILVSLNRPAGPAGASVYYEVSGTAEEGIHFQIGGVNPLRFAPGVSELAIPITLLESGLYYRERFLQVELTSVQGVELHPLDRTAQFWIRPSVPPPTLSLGGAQVPVSPGSFAYVPVQLSGPSMEPVSFHYRTDPASDLTDYAFAPTGTVLFQPGETAKDLRLFCFPTAQRDQRLIVHLEHERSAVSYVIPKINPGFTTNSDLYDQEVHIDENLWSFSNGGIQAFEQSDLINPAPVGRAMPGVPTDHLTGGTGWVPGMEDRSLIDLLDQSSVNPITDPFSGIPLKIYAMSSAANSGMPYLRKSFNATFCGGNAQLYPLPEFVRVSYYLHLPEGLDSPRAVPFFRAGLRIRTQDINHAVTFQIGSMGVDNTGQPTQVWQTSQFGPIGVWDTMQINSQTDAYGIVEDEYGVRVWYAHKLDPTVGYPHHSGEVRFETPGVDQGNPIEYPTWLSENDGSLATLGLNSIDQAVGKGNMPYGFMWEVSDTSLLTGDLKPYFPKPGSWWEPIGNAVIAEATSLVYRVQ